MGDELVCVFSKCSFCPGGESAILLSPIQNLRITVTKVFASLSENNAEEFDPLIGIHSYSAAGT